MLSAHVEQKDIDLVIVTGDCIDHDHEDLSSEALEVVSSIAPGAFRMFVLGNHDFVSNSAPAVRKKLISIGFEDMTSRHVRCTIDGAPLNLYGLDDYLEGEIYIPQIAETFEPEAAVLFLHSLDAMQEGFPDSFDLVLSGHLHAGGEIRFGAFDGVTFMKLLGKRGNFNRQKVGWDTLSRRVLSYVSPGMSRRFFTFRTVSPGATLHRLRCLA